MRATKRPVNKKSFTISEITLIINACALNGVTTLKCGELELDFRKHGTKEPQNIPVAEMTEQQIVTNARESLEKDELEMREEQIAELLITDPEEAERMLADGEFENDGELELGDRE